MILEVIIWYLFLLDALFANVAAWLFPSWYKKNFKGFTKYIPLTKVWAVLYLFLVAWVGFALFRLGVL